jgi:uncharacterized protein (DUF433 family)
MVPTLQNDVEVDTSFGGCRTMALVRAEQDRIVCDPKIRFGKPCIRGTRVAVSDVLRWFGSGMSADEILAAYPHLTREGLHAALRYAAEIVDDAEDGEH